MPVRVPGALSRRDLLRLGGGLGAAGLLAGASGCASPLASGLVGAPPAAADVIFWHLFGGGDGANMGTMVADTQRATGRSVEATLLSWGNPYYTKLALSASSGRPPDVAVVHLSRLSLLSRAGLVSPLEEVGAADAGITEDRFTPAAWSKATVDGTTYAVPLDTHPFVMFYNRDLAEKAGLLEGDRLRELSGRDDLVAAMTAMRDAGAEYGAVSANVTDPSTTWRFFYMLYRGIADPLVTDSGTRVAVDREAAEETFAFMSSLTGDLGLMPGNATPTTVSTLFGQGRAGFLFDGVWQIPTYQGVSLPSGEPLPFDVAPFPAILGDDPRSYADSHALVVPRSDARPERRTQDAVRFVRELLDRSATWTDGGHVPAWLPTQESAEFREKEPQSGYTQAAFDAVYDPEAWYTGAGSDFQNAMGAVMANVLAGRRRPGPATDDLLEALRGFATALPPVR